MGYLYINSFFKRVKGVVITIYIKRIFISESKKRHKSIANFSVFTEVIPLLKTYSE